VKTRNSGNRRWRAEAVKDRKPYEENQRRETASPGQGKISREL
jgi:hypothetical protein